MIRTQGILPNGKLITNFPLKNLSTYQFRWYWIDFDNPNQEDITQLKEYFCFHPLTIEDCIHQLQRPKLEFYDDYKFLVLHALPKIQEKPIEVNLFVSKNYLVSFHYSSLKEIDIVWDRIVQKSSLLKSKGFFYASYKIVDKLVDAYFPILNNIERKVEVIEENNTDGSSKKVINKIFRVRKQLSRLRQTVDPMKDVIYRFLNSQTSPLRKKEQIYVEDIHDHLIRLSTKIEANREIISDITENYISLNSYKMNSIMMTLTIITTIFMPLTFIAGVYGMNFDYMPELKWQYSYFVLLGFMFLVSFCLFFFFKKKGWFNNH